MTDLFQQTQNNEPTIDENKNYLEELVGEGRKFKDVEALAKGKHYSDAMIKVMERQLDDLRAENERNRTELLATTRLQELIDQARSSPQNPVTPNPNVNDNEKSGLKMEDIESLFSNKLQEHENAKRERENFNTVQNKLKEKYGENFHTHLIEHQKTLGLTAEEINSMARRQPQVLIKAFGLDAPAQQNNLFQAPPRSNQRNDNFAPRGEVKRTWSYYQEMKKKNPGLFHDPQTNIQMQQDYIALGAAFEDGDFHA